MTPEEQEEAAWILKRVPAILQEYQTHPQPSHSTNPNAMDEDGRDPTREMEEHQRGIVESIVYALRYMLRDHLEPAFIEHYRADRVAKKSVRKHLHDVLEEDGEYERMKMAKTKVENLLQTLTEDTNKDEAAGSEEETILKLQKTLEEAKEQLETTAKKEATLKAELEELEQAEKDAEKKDDDDDDNLFGNDDDDEEENEKKKEIEEEVRCTLQ